jgi:hypothetical protein
MSKEVVAKKKDLVTVYGTGESKHMPLGKKYLVHSVHAETLIAKGAASKSPVEAKGKKGDK